MPVVQAARAAQAAHRPQPCPAAALPLPAAWGRTCGMLLPMCAGPLRVHTRLRRWGPPVSGRGPRGGSEDGQHGAGLTTGAAGQQPRVAEGVAWGCLKWISLCPAPAQPLTAPLWLPPRCRRLARAVAALAPALITAACYDREVNCRRAAAAAFQVWRQRGRHPWYRHLLGPCPAWQCLHEMPWMGRWAACSGGPAATSPESPLLCSPACA